ncbi:MAG: SDR family NAD(P)-dependent oxidoreductase, partial [Acidimicrobiales bacterium]|nr:SDR family NAD(P)-dependent oxidoreductase [Acidimicrobiales bacterium]
MARSLPPPAAARHRRGPCQTPGPMEQLQGRVAVVTGAGSGIGRATSVALAARGCRLALVDR